MPTYATPADYAARPNVTDLPDNVAALLASASLLIAEETSTALYSFDAVTLLPTDATLVGVLRDATCAQAAWWDSLGVDPSRGIVAEPVKRSKGIGSARVDYDTSSVALTHAQRVAAVSQLAPDALRMLRAAGLLSSNVWAY